MGKACKAFSVFEETDMTHSFRYRILSILLALLWILSGLPFASADNESPAATDLTRWLTIAQSRGHTKPKEHLNDDVLNETFPYGPFEAVRLSWEKAPQKPAYLCIQWGELPERVLLRQLDKDGATLSEGYAAPVYDAVIPLSEDTASMMIISDSAGMDLARLALFSEGALPAPFFDWQETPRGMDYLLISTHPDDDTLFMGGIIPTYGAEMGYVGTVAYVTKPTRKRVNEAMLGAWEMGTRYRPIVIGFQDIRGEIKEGFQDRFRAETVTLALVRLLREYRPLVVFTHDLKGEYGHWQHRIVAASTVEACRLAADPAFDPISCERFGTWEVKKCYLHLYAEDPLVMDIHTPLSSRGGRTAFEVAQAAFKKHQSQQNGRHKCEDDGDRYAMNRYGMAYGTVEAGNDVFDNIDPTLFASYIPPEPTPEPKPEPTIEPMPEPTAEPTPEPASTVEPTQKPSPEPTTAPTQAPTSKPSSEPTSVPTLEPTQTDAKPTAKDVLLPILYVLIGAAAASGVFLLIRRKRGRS